MVFFDYHRRMKNFGDYLRVAMLLAVLYAVSFAPAFAASGSCYNIADADARAYCAARTGGGRAFCYNIKDAVKRSSCLAEVSK